MYWGFALGSECWESVVFTRISFVIVLNRCVVLMEGSCINLKVKLNKIYFTMTLHFAVIGTFNLASSRLSQ